MISGMETWLDVVGYEGFYEVSSLGRVRSAPRVAGRGFGRGGCRPISATILKPWPDKNGYAKIVLCVDNKRKSISVHRLVAMAFLGEQPDRPFVNHKNGRTDDNRIENLEWVTSSENTQHALSELGRQYGRAGSAIIAYNDEVERRFGSLREARLEGFHKSAILACLSGARPRHKGFQWKRVA